MHKKSTPYQSNVIWHREKKSICNKVDEEWRMCKEADSVVCKKESVDGSKTIQSEVNLDQHFTSSFFDNYCKLVMTVWFWFFAITDFIFQILGDAMMSCLVAVLQLTCLIVYCSHKDRSFLKDRVTHNIFAHNIGIKRYWDKQIFFLQNIVVTFKNIFKLQYIISFFTNFSIYWQK